MDYITTVIEDEEVHGRMEIIHIVIVYAKRAPRRQYLPGLHTRSVRRYPEPNNILMLSVER